MLFIATNASLEELEHDKRSTLCRVTVELHRLGVSATAITSSDREQLPNLGRGFNAEVRYRELLAELENDDERSK
jgi:hypothetical protein